MRCKDNSISTPVDSPGFDDTTKSDLEVLIGLISEWLGKLPWASRWQYEDRHYRRNLVTKTTLCKLASILHPIMELEKPFPPQFTENSSNTNRWNMSWLLRRWGEQRRASKALHRTLLSSWRTYGTFWPLAYLSSTYCFAEAQNSLSLDLPKALGTPHSTTVGPDQLKGTNSNTAKESLATRWRSQLYCDWNKKTPKGCHCGDNSILWETSPSYLRNGLFFVQREANIGNPL